MDFLQDYFLVPVMRNGWFNPVNSLAYGLVLIAAIWLVFRLLKLLEIKIDRFLFLALTPFIAFAGVTRVLRDQVYSLGSAQPGFFSSFTGHMAVMQQSSYSYVYSITNNSIISSIDSYIIAWFPTPGSYFITFLMALVSLVISAAAQRRFRIAYWKMLFVLGCVFLGANTYLLPFHSITPFIYIAGVSTAWAALFFSLGYLPGSRFHREISKNLKSGFRIKIGTKIQEKLKQVFSPLNSAVLSAHFVDATATFFAIAFFTTAGGAGYSEQHFLPRTLMLFLGPQVMFLLKLVVIVPVLYFIDNYMGTEAEGRGRRESGKGTKDKTETKKQGWNIMDEKEFGNFLKLVIFILGLSPGIRDMVRLVAGV